MNHKQSRAHFAKVAAAAEAGDQEAQLALARLEEAAGAVQLRGLSGPDQGREEARRRFGPLPEDAA